MPSITELVSNINRLGGLAKPNRYLVYITPPGSLAGDARVLTFLTPTAMLPGVTFNTDDVRHKGYGLVERRATSASIDPITITFNLDNAGTVIKFFKDWFELIYPHEVDHTQSTSHVGLEDFNYPANYWGHITIVLRDSSDNDVATYTLTDCYPMSISDVQLGWDMNDTIATTTVTFTYRSHHIQVANK